MAAEFANALEWADRNYQRLCQHVAQHGEHKWELLASGLSCHTHLLQLKWHVLLVRAAPTILGVKQQPDKWANCRWELEVVQRINGFLKSYDYKQANIHQIIASWLPGRTANAVKQAIKAHIEPAGVLPDGFHHQTVLEVLKAWPGVHRHHQAYLLLPAQQVAQYLLNEAPQLLTTAPESKASTGSQTTSGKRKREAGPVQEDKAAGGTSNSLLLPLDRYSSRLSSSSGMALSGVVAPRTSATLGQGLAAAQQLLPQPSYALTVLTGRQSCSSNSSLGVDELGSAGSVTTAMATAGMAFNSLVEQLSAAQHYQAVPQQPEQKAATIQRKRSRLSKCTVAQQFMQQGSAGAASGANSQTVSGHGLVPYSTLGLQAVWSQPLVLEPVLGASGGGNVDASTTAAASAVEAAATPTPLKPASWGSLDSTATGQLTGDQLTSGSGWNNTWYGVGQLLGSAVAAPVSHHPHQIGQPQQQDSLVWGAAVTASSGEAAAGSGGALAAAACGSFAVQLPAHATSGWYASQLVQQDCEQAQPHACMGFEALAAATALPECQRAADSATFAADHFQVETVDLLHTAYESWIQLEQGATMAALISSNQGSASASPVARSDDNIGLSGLTELLGYEAEAVEMVVDAAHHGWPVKLVCNEIVSDSIFDNFSESDDLSDLETELGLGDWVELGQHDLLLPGC